MYSEAEEISLLLPIFRIESNIFSGCFSIPVGNALGTRCNNGTTELVTRQYLNLGLRMTTSMDLTKRIQAGYPGYSDD